jgi:hypothetical protein
LEAVIPCDNHSLRQVFLLTVPIGYHLRAQT